MQNRIKALRKSQKLTQTEFGARIGIKGTTVTGYESGNRTPSDAMILSICREFNVSELWLRTGEGEMFMPLPDASIDSLDSHLLDAFHSLTLEDKALLLFLASRLVAGTTQTTGGDTDEQQN